MSMCIHIEARRPQCPSIDIHAHIHTSICMLYTQAFIHPSAWCTHTGAPPQVPVMHMRMDDLDRGSVLGKGASGQANCVSACSSICLCKPHVHPFVSANHMCIHLSLQITCASICLCKPHVHPFVSANRVSVHASTCLRRAAP